MKYTTLGRTDLKVSRICLGTMTYGEQNTQDEAFEQMDYALSQGVNFFDTAELYAIPPKPETQGATETIIGNWFKARNNREDVILATKIAGPGIPWIRGGEEITPAAIQTALEGSLKRLKTDYVDLYQLHWTNRPHYHFGQVWDFNPDPSDTQKRKDNLLAVLKTVDDFVKEGKIRHFGLSDDTAWGVMNHVQLAEQHNLPRIVSIQNEYNLLNRMFEPDLAEISLREDVGLLVWSPLATGMLSGKYAKKPWPKNSRWTLLDKEWLQRNTSQAHGAVDRYLAIAKKYDLDPCQMAIAFTLQQPFVTSSIIGATKMWQLENNIAAIDVALSDDVLADIAEVRRDYPLCY